MTKIRDNISAVNLDAILAQMNLMRALDATFASIRGANRRERAIIPPITTPPINSEDTTPPINDEIGPQLPDPNAEDIPILPTVISEEPRTAPGLQSGYSREAILDFINNAVSSNSELESLINDPTKLSGAITLKDEDPTTLPGNATEEEKVTRLLGTTISLLKGVEETLTAISAATSSNTGITPSNAYTLFRQKEALENFVEKFDRLEALAPKNDRVLFSSFEARMRLLANNIKTNFSSNTAFYGSLSTAVLNKFGSDYANNEDEIRASLTAMQDHAINDPNLINSSDNESRNQYLMHYERLNRFLDQSDLMASAQGASSREFYTSAHTLAESVRTLLTTKQPITNKMYEDRTTEYHEYFLSGNSGFTNIMDRIDAVFAGKLTPNSASAASLKVDSGKGNTIQRYYNYAASFISKAYKLEQMIVNASNFNDPAFDAATLARIRAKREMLEGLINANHDYYAAIPGFDFAD